MGNFSHFYTLAAAPPGLPRHARVMDRAGPAMTPWPGQGQALHGVARSGTKCTPTMPLPAEGDNNPDGRMRHIASSAIRVPSTQAGKVASRLPFFGQLCLGGDKT